jgi:hypothetical protein
MNPAAPSLPLSFADFLHSLNSTKFKDLWPAQDHILAKYKDFSLTPDLAVELPTGAGKTLIALLIAEAWRRSGGKVAILSANKTLARQMLGEANSLGIPAVLMEGRGQDIPGTDKRAYQRAAKVAIMNYWVYFNQNPVLDPADLLVMDDAHLAEHCLHSLFSVEITKFSHPELFSTIVTTLRDAFPGYAVLNDALAEESVGNITPPELLSFFDQIQIADRLRTIIDSSAALGSDADLRFRWQRARLHLKEANIYIGTTTIWVRPYVYPLSSFEHYRETTQRLYVSATIGDPADLARRLGVNPITTIPVDAQFGEKTSGRRLIIMNRLEESDIPPRLGGAIFAALSVHPKSVWLCSSGAIAKRYKEIVSEWLNKCGFVGHPTWMLSPLGDEIDAFKAAPMGHLFVAGRFDGMDFKANECRLVVITTLPRAINIQEEFITAYLRDAGFMRRRLNSRIIQALGRCNRAEDDFGVYILADRRFATHFGRESNREGIPRNMIAELDIAQDTAELDDQTIRDNVTSFLQGNFGAYDASFAQYLGSVPQSQQSNMPLSASKVVKAEVTAWSAMYESQNYGLAADRFEEVWKAYRDENIIELGAFHKWNQAKATYLQSLSGEPGSQGKAYLLAEEAIGRGNKTSWFNRLRASLNRTRSSSQPSDGETADYGLSLARAFDEFLELNGTRERFEKACQRISAALASDKHDQYCEGLKSLGVLLAYNASRPKGSAATDNRWRGTFGNSKEAFTFEAKIEHVEGNAITSSHMGQAHNQLNRALAELAPLGYTVRGTILTHLGEIDPAARSSAGPIRILRKDAVLSLWKHVEGLLRNYANGWKLDDVTARIAKTQALLPRCPPAGWLVQALSVDELLVSSDDLLRGWPTTNG